MEPESKPPPPPPADAAPRRFGPYLLERELGRGGMGVVYLAYHEQLRRKVALKVLLGAEFTTDRARSRFQREAEAAAALRHQNIVSVHEIGEEGGQAYFTMDAVDGTTLREWCAARRPSIEAGIALLVKVCDAIGYAHAHGIIHRDLKPTNIIVDGTGEPHVVDFGLAKRTGAGDLASQTRSGAILGTPHYMSPEQAEGRNECVSVRSDVYALGVILYELIADEVPFRSDSFSEMIRMIVHDDPPPLRSRVPSTSRDLEVIVAKAMAKEPERRYWGAYALKADLERWLQHEPISARGASIAYRVRKWVERHRVATAIALTVLAVLGASFGRSYYELARGRERLRRAIAQRERARAALARTLAGSGAGREARALEAKAALDELLETLAEARRMAGETDPDGILAQEIDAAASEAERARRLIADTPAAASPPH